jgi:hypothetical protein
MSRSLKIWIKTWRRAEFIKSDEDGEILSGNIIASRRTPTDMVAAASDINLWKEWAAEDALVKEKNIRYQK